MNKQINITELLDWYLWAGVSETCADLPCLISEKEETFTLSQANKTPAVKPKPLPTQPAPSRPLQPTFPASDSVRDLCLKAQSLDDLRNLVQNFEGCNLKNTAASTVFGDGSAMAKIVIIGEAPGADEDRIGRPFVGRCGKLLDKMLASVQLERQECFITNVLPWRPPGNRTPTDEEIAICLPFLKRQIELIKPDYLLLLGGIALKTVMDTTDSISRTRGKWLEYSINGEKTAQVLATYHPSYLLRSCAQKSKVWSDLLRLKQKIGNNS